MNTQLLILGNGFDLHCGLKSKYNDFFSFRIDTRKEKILVDTINFVHNEIYSSSENKDIIYEQNVTVKNNIRKRIIANYERERSDTFGDLTNELSDLTLWEIIFFINKLNKNSVNWSDIEWSIGTFLKSPYYDDEYLTYFGIKDNSYLQNSSHDILFTCYIALFFPDLDYRNEEETKRLLLVELGKLETAFMNYLNSMVIANKDYEENSKITFHTLINYYSDFYKFEKIDSTYTITFNYTNPLPKSPNANINNIHGNLEKENIIFGLDISSIDCDTIDYQFTKNFKKMIDLKSTPLELPKQTKHIKFFGHSLSKADYSYFQSIFDYYDIYSSDIELIFFYSIYSDKTESEIRQEEVLKISMLIEQYGATIGNISRGKNLINKLILENRLKVINIETVRREMYDAAGININKE